MELNNYLHFNGNCEEAFKFYEKSTGGKIQAMMTHEGAPPEMKVPDAWRSKIMHARMTIGNNLLMGSDAPPERYSKPAGFSINIGVKTAEEAERIYKALSEGGKIEMPLAETFWAIRFGMFVDKFGVPWMVNAEKAQA
jgi:PhnB protein